MDNKLKRRKYPYLIRIALDADTAGELAKQAERGRVPKSLLASEIISSWLKSATETGQQAVLDKAAQSERWWLRSRKR